MPECCGELIEHDAEICPFCGHKVPDLEEDLDLIRRQEISDFEDSRGLE